MSGEGSTIVVGMSGGVDSSVTALLLKQQGYRVIGIFMKNWEEEDESGICKSSVEYEDVMRVCDHLDIPCYSVNFVQQYWDRVFTEFLEQLKQGATPNPDVLCNREIKFKELLGKALELGADKLATGHYCRVDYKDGAYRLLKGSDPNKDQSYFLHAIKQKALEKALFPVGEMIKTDLRELARRHSIPVSEKKDSTGICFIGKRNFKTFISKYLPAEPGDFEDPQGHVVGRHDGLAFYTIGQRKGIGIGGAGEPWFVVGKDLERNAVTIAQGENHPALFVDRLQAEELTWISPEGAPPLPFRCKAKVRYRQPDQDCVIVGIEDGVAFVVFDKPQRAVTPRQSVVFYDGACCLGGGVIKGWSQGNFIKKN